MESYKDEVVYDVLPMDACHLLLGKPWQYDRDVTHHGQSNTYSFKMKGKKMTLTRLAPSQTLKTENGKGNHKGIALLVNRGRVERVISKGKHVFVVLILESAPKSDPTTLHNSIQPLIKDFEDVFP